MQSASHGCCIVRWLHALLVAAACRASAVQFNAQQGLKVVLGAGNVSKAAGAGLLLASSQGHHGLKPGDGGHAPQPSSRCGVRERVTAQSELHGQCPAGCPLYSHSFDEECSFTCVTASRALCSATNKLEPIPDRDLGICRTCRIAGCESCALDSTDSCGKCSMGYTLHQGRCHSRFAFLWHCAFGILGVLILLIIAWVLDLSLRPITNEEGLRKGLACRSRAKPHQPRINTPQQSPRVMAESTPAAATAGDTGNPNLNPPAHHSSTRELWPLSTNLLTTRVAGPGIMLHFNFQFVVILWALAVALGWAALAGTVDSDLFVLGKKQFETPRQHCIVVKWGYETQQRLMWTKVGFVFGVYFASFALALALGVRQLRMFQREDAEHTSHKDFAALCTGLPQLCGRERLEEELEKCLAASLGRGIVGVSVCWDFKQDENILMEVIESDLCDREEMAEKQVLVEQPLQEKAEEKAAGAESQPNTWVPKALSQIFDMIEKAFLSPTTQKIIRKGRRNRLDKYRRRKIHKAERARRTPRVAEGSARRATPPNLQAAVAEAAARGESPWSARDTASNSDSAKSTPRFESSTQRSSDEKMRETSPPLSARQQVHVGDNIVEVDVEEVLVRLECCDQAFVVFESEALRDAAVAAAKRSGGVGFRSTTLQLSVPPGEPNTVVWRDCTNISFAHRLGRLAVGLSTIAAALSMWGLLFYLPWAYFVMSWNYAYGQQPSLVNETAFSMMVVMGNAVMYFVCSEVADRIGFRYNDSREVCYMLLYSFACFSNVVLDMVITYFVAYRALVGVGMRTYDGRRLADVETFTERFEAYAMQRDLANNVWLYSFPSTFLVPFVLEPFVTIYVPYKIMTLIIRSHPEYHHAIAEDFLSSSPVDLSRYADVLLNLMLAVVILWYPGGYTVQMFLALAMSHIVIYVYDHYRVLRTIQSCHFATMDMDWWAQWMLSIPCGLVLSCGVFKANCQPGYHCFRDADLIAVCSGAFLCHIAMHTLLLVYVVPCFRMKALPPSNDTYKQCAKRIASSWFNCNPIHCLRSQFIYKQFPPSDFCMPGKEHLLRTNDAIGAHFKDHPVDVEDYEAKPVSYIMQRVSSSVSALSFSGTSPIGAASTPEANQRLADMLGAHAAGQRVPPIRGGLA